MDKIRCFGNKPGQELYAHYHDHEWGIPVYDDRLLFEMLILEGAQAGLNWETILKKRRNYRQLFYNFDLDKVASMTDQQLDKLLDNPGIIRNKLKIYSTRKNAKSSLKYKKSLVVLPNIFGSLLEENQLLTIGVVLQKLPLRQKKV